MRARTTGGHLHPVAVGNAVLIGGLGVDAQKRRRHELTDERGMAHCAVMEMRQTARGDDKRVLVVGQRALRGLVERADGIVILACLLFKGKHVREACAGKTQHGFAVHIHLTRHRGKAARQPVGNNSLVLPERHVLFHWRLGIHVIGVRSHLVP